MLAFHFASQFLPGNYFQHSGAGMQGTLSCPDTLWIVGWHWSWTYHITKRAFSCCGELTWSLKSSTLFLVSCKCVVSLEDKERSFLLVWQFCFWLLGLSGLLPICDLNWRSLFFPKDLTKQVNHTTFLQMFRHGSAAEFSSIIWDSEISQILLPSEECSAVTFWKIIKALTVFDVAVQTSFKDSSFV